MSKIRLAAVLIVLATLVVSANNYLSEDDLLVEQYKICRYGFANKDVVVNACNEVLAQLWLPDVSRSALLRARASAFRQRGEYGRALADATQAISLNPGDARAFWARSQIYLKLEDLERAELDYEKAHSLTPEDGDLVYWWIYHMADLGQHGRELAGCENLITIEPNERKSMGCKVRALIKLKRYSIAVEALL